MSTYPICVDGENQVGGNKAMTQVNEEKWGRVISVRLKPQAIARIDAYRRAQLDPPTRARAIADLIDLALGEALAE